MSTIEAIARQNPPVRRESGRIPPKIRERAARLASGRGWKGLGVSDEQIAAALGIDRRNAARRRAGESGPFAGTCVEATLLAAAKIAIRPLISHLRVIDRQGRIRDVPTSVLEGWFQFLHVRETEADARMDEAQIRMAVGDPVCLRDLAERARRHMDQLEEIAAICEELIAREEAGRGARK